MEMSPGGYRDVCLLFQLWEPFYPSVSPLRREASEQIPARRTGAANRAKQPLWRSFDIFRKNVCRSPITNGAIISRGHRYAPCPWEHPRCIIIHVRRRNLALKLGLARGLIRTNGRVPIWTIHRSAEST